MSGYIDSEASEDNTYDYDDDGGSADDNIADEPVEQVLKEPKTEKITSDRICDWCVKRGVATPRTKVKNTNLCSKHLQEYNEKLSGEWARKQAQKEVDKKKRQLLKEKERAKLNAAKNKRYAEEGHREKKKIAKINDEAAINGIAFMNDISFDQAAELYYRRSQPGSQRSSQRSSRTVSQDVSESEAESEAESESEKGSVRAEASDVPKPATVPVNVLEEFNAKLNLLAEQLRISEEGRRQLETRLEKTEALVNDPKNAAKVLNLARGKKKDKKIVDVPIDPMNLEAREEATDSNENNIKSNVGAAPEPPVDIMT